MRSSARMARRIAATAIAAALAAIAVPAAYANFDGWAKVEASTPRADGSDAHVSPMLLHRLPPEDQAATTGGPQIGGYSVALTARAQRTDAPGGGATSRSADSPRHHGGFSWRDAAIGTGFAVGLALVVAGAGLAARRRRAPVAATD